MVLDTPGPEIYIGRYFERREEGVVLLDVDFHHDGDEGRSKQDFVSNAARFGQWKKLQSKTVPPEQITLITRLADHAQR